MSLGDTLRLRQVLCVLVVVECCGFHLLVYMFKICLHLAQLSGFFAQVAGLVRFESQVFYLAVLGDEHE